MPNLASVSSAWRITSQSDLLPIITATSGLKSVTLLPLGQRKADLAVESAQALRGRNLNSRAADTAHQRQNLVHADLPLRHKSAAEAVDAEGLGASRRPDFDAAIIDHLQRQTIPRRSIARQ